MKNKLVTIVVVYNKLIKDITVVDTLKSEYIDFCFVDNSTIEDVKNKNKEYCKKTNYRYVDMQGNKGLSKAYNNTIDLLRNEYKYILLSDDDTIYNQDYINKLLEQVDADQYDLILATVVDKMDNTILTPVFYSDVPLKRVKQEESTRIGGINSGTCIKMSAFDNWKFNEDLFMYFTDLDFYNNNANANKLSYIILDATIYQDCAGSEEYNDKTIEQIKRVLNDGKKYYKTQKFGFLQYCFYKTLLVIGSFIQHKKISILSLLFV